MVLPSIVKGKHCFWCWWYLCFLLPLLSFLPSANKEDETSSGRFSEATFPAHASRCRSCFGSSTTCGVCRALIRMSTHGRRHLGVVSLDKVQTVAATLPHWGSSRVKGGLDQGPQALALSRVTCEGREGCPAPAKIPAQAKRSSRQEK